jgi:hypothetical protein
MGHARIGVIRRRFVACAPSNFGSRSNFSELTDGLPSLGLSNVTAPNCGLLPFKKLFTILLSVILT